jgi:hypothetical protein
MSILGPKVLEKELTLGGESRFKLFRAIAIAAGPRLGAVLVTAVASRMRVFHAQQVEIFFPIWPFLGQRRVAKASLDPGRHLVVD